MTEGGRSLAVAADLNPEILLRSSPDEIDHRRLFYNASERPRIVAVGRSGSKRIWESSDLSFFLHEPPGSQNHKSVFSGLWRATRGGGAASNSREDLHCNTHIPQPRYLKDRVL